MSYETAVLPTRVIDVGSDGPPHLVEPEGKRGRYITLSHRWGKHAKIETKTCNIARFKQALPMDELPQTFKDVIIVTRELGFQYIWIDSLCIVQNDTEDWVRESEQMGDIFESSSCTIAAVHALDENSNDCGLFIPRNDPLAIDICCPISKEALPELSAKILNSNGKICVWKYKWLGGGLGAANITDIISRNTIVLRPRITSLWHKMRQSEWYNRGWVFQERILARRIIYYAHDKLYWDCFEEQGDEQGAETKSPTRTAWFSPDGMKASAPQSFRNLLAREYSTSILSKRKDKLNAITGICNKFRDYGGNNFYAGILDDATGESLLWYASEAAMLLYDDFHAPSWTWVNRSGQPSYYLPEPLMQDAKCLPAICRFGRDMAAT